MTVRRLAGGVFAPTYPALVAWAFEELLRDGPITTRACENCGIAFVPQRDAKFCSRPALGQKSLCRVLAGMDRYYAKDKPKEGETDG